MKIRKNNIKKSMLFALAGLLGILAFNTPTYAAEALSGTYASGTDKTVTIAQAGKYTFNLYGAQGGSYGSYDGGKGGYVSFSKQLAVGDKVRVVTGAGAGTGTLTNGGGYSAIYINGTLAGIAGGGGGAVKKADGGDGGVTGSGDTTTSFTGGATTDSYHTHDGNAQNGGDCYQTPVYHQHTGNSATLGGCYTEPVRHVHSGDATNGGACYQTPVYHEHSTSTCTYTTVSGTVWIPVEYYVHNNGKGDYYFYGDCPNCGRVYAGSAHNGLADYVSPYPHPCPNVPTVPNWTCGKDETTVMYYDLSCTESLTSIKSYAVGCGKTTSTVDYYDFSCEIVPPDSAGGGGGYKGGSAGFAHVHYGDTTSGGECYRTPIYHSHSSSCYKNGQCPGYSGAAGHHPSCSDSGSDWGTDNGHIHCVAYCTTCGAINYAWSKCTATVPILNCTRAGLIDSYELSCTQGDYYEASKGGSNYINTSLVTAINNQGGVNGSASYQAGKAVVEIIDSVSVALNTNKPSVTNNNATVSPTSITVLASHFMDTLPEPKLIGYDFLGWTPAKSSTTYVTQSQEYNAVANPTLYAQWAAKDMVVKLDKNNLYADKISTAQYTYKYDAFYNIPTPTSKYSNFKNWSIDAAGTKKITNGTTRVQTTVDTDNITVYAQWTPATVTLKFDATTNGGILSGSSSKTVTNESLVGTLPTATRSGYNFLGWFTAPTGGEEVSAGSIALFDKSKSTHTLYAQFEVKVTDWPFGYTGSTQTWTAPSSGYYLFEAYGAQGASINATQIGGKGGYVSGVRFLNKGDIIYVNVGGQGQTFNGGGTGTVKNGGGGTDFRYKGTAASNRFLVAGGGGGATETKVGGDGGVADSGNNATLVNGSNNNEEGGAGGGGGYYGGTAGYLIRHYHAEHGCQSHWHNDNCYYDIQPGLVSTYDEVWHTSCGAGPGHCPGFCSYCGGHSGYCGLNHSGKALGCSLPVGWWCGMYDGQITGEAASVGGSNYVDSTLYYQKDQGGIRKGNGYAKITAMYVVVLDTNKPSTTNNYTANATNIPFVDNVDTLLKEKNLPYTTPNYSRFESTGDDNNKTTYGLYFVRDMFTYGDYEKLPVPTLKGWKFIGWYTYPQIDAGVKVTNNTQVKITNGLTLLDNHTLYAHWQPETYYIKYYMNNTNKNVYSDVYTDPVAKFDNTLNGALKSGATKYTYNSTEDCYIQTVKYDHDIEVLPNYYAKTGYYFKNWTNKSDTNLAGTKGTGTGTGKQTGTGYYESTVLKQHKDGETFKANFGNFNYITNEKALALGTETTPVWKYGNQTVVLYAIWEPIKYSLRFNGTDNWNSSSIFSIGSHTGQDSYLQKVTNASGNQDTKIRYDQVFTLNANLFKRQAPHTITSEDGLSVVLKTGYGHIGWGFGKDTMSYSASPSYKLLSMNTKADNDQALISDSDTTGRDYKENQSNVKNVISQKGIEVITKYISDWTNARTNSNRKDKTDIENNVIESNLHSLWRRNSNDNHINDDVTGCPCPDDGNGGCICPSDQCPDRDNDGTCDYHDPDPDDPTIPSKCPCGTDENGNCICPSDNCPDNDNDGVCDNHDPNPNDPTIPNDGHDHGNSCPCGPDGSGNCKCPSSNCPDKDGDGICDNHDPDLNNPNIPNPNGDDNDDCPCGSDGNGNCICPSDSCPDRDGDGIWYSVKKKYKLNVNISKYNICYL